MPGAALCSARDPFLGEAMETQDLNLGFLQHREAGILLHVTSLPGGHGVGDLGAGAYQFVDWMVQAGLKIWQMLPLVPPGRGFSPYSTWSSLALGIWLIDLDELGFLGLLGSNWAAESAEAHQRLGAAAQGGPWGSTVNVEAMESFKLSCLRRAWKAFAQRGSSHPLHQAFAEFQAQHDWLAPAALYGALRAHFGCAWTEWPAEDASPTPERLRTLMQEHAEAVAEASFFQFLAHDQLMRLKRYASRQGVRLVGDLPIYVDLDSVDVWLNRSLFDLDDAHRPRRVSGVPPDAFTELGQLWNHPLYRWDEHAKTGFAWWIRRLGRCLEQTDIVRIDHFRGFAAYWSIPGGAPDARRGEWVQGPGLALFRALEKGLGGRLPVIAEDLGYIDEAVRELKRQAGLPGMCVLEFGFGTPDSDGDRVHHPDHHPQYAVAYTGTHDNEPVVQWRRSLGAAERSNLARFFQHEQLSDSEFAEHFVDLALSSRAQLVVIPLQDFLALGAEARMNRPATESGNWVWRASESHLSAARAGLIRQKLTKAHRLGDQQAKAT